MKLLTLWDPANPVVPVAPVLAALRGHVEVFDLTFEQVAHRTLPNGRFGLRPTVDKLQPDGLLWVEGGPLPGDMDECGCRKACWLVNPHLEPTLYEDLAPLFDVRFTTLRAMTADETCTWLPLAASNGGFASAPGIEFAGGDPTPASHASIAVAVGKLAAETPPPSFPVVVCPGEGTRPHPGVFDRMASGAVAIVDPESDVRDIGHPGEHLLVYPSLPELPAFLRELLEKREIRERVAVRGPGIVEHLHTPELRARQLQDGIWPQARVLGGRQHNPAVSVLTYCYKYLQRFRHYLESLAGQKLASGSLEIVVTDPESPDGLADFLQGFAARNPHLRIVHLPISRTYHRNRGVCINRAFDASSGRTIVVTDGDVIFPPDLISHLASISRTKPKTVLGVRRSFLDKETTAEILDGRRDPFREFSALAASSGDGEPDAFEGVLGYCQVVSREAFAKARYPEEFDMTNQSDIVFNERLGRYAGVSPLCLADRTVLHLWHPRNWSGAKEFL